MGRATHPRKRSANRPLAALPRREVLETLVHRYYHVRQEHKRAHPGSRYRRRIEDRQMDVRERFERSLAEWVRDGELRDAWRAHLEYRGAAPREPASIRPLVFEGVSESSGSVVEIRGTKGEQLTVEVDGALVERIPYDDAFAATQPPVTFLVARAGFVEAFSASADALEALATFREEGGSPPWEYVEELLGDGLIDPTAALTPRGHRAHASRKTPP
jgi:hypothetical protein